MGKNGLLDLGNAGFAMPVTNSPYPKPTYHSYIENLHISYETDYDAVSAFLPAELEFADEIPIANIGINHFKFSTFGSYMEAYLSYNVLFEGKPYNYYPYWLCGPCADGTITETGMLMGREYFGTAKKMAKIEMVKENNIICATVSRPSNMPLFTIAMSPTEHVDIPDGSDTAIDLRYIPGVDPDAGPDVCQLVASEVTSWTDKLSDGLTDSWTGDASITFQCESTTDPWFKNKVVRVIGASYGNYSKAVLPGYVLHDYLK